MINVYLFGMNPITNILISYLQKDDRYSLLGVTADREYCSITDFNGIPVIPFEDLPIDTKDFSIINCVGYAKQLMIRESVGKKIISKNIHQLTYIHPSSIIDGVKLGDGNIVMANVIVEPNAIMGDGNLLYAGCHVGHDVIIGNFNWLYTRCVVMGNVRVGNRNIIGSNSCIRSGLEVGNASNIGIGAVVVKNVESEKNVFGNPAIEVSEIMELI